jgi:hypothetical protein
LFFNFLFCFSFTAQSFALGYHPGASPVLCPEDREDLSNPSLPSSSEFQFFAPRFFLSILPLKNGMKRSANQGKPISVLAVF